MEFAEAKQKALAQNYDTLFSVGAFMHCSTLLRQLGVDLKPSEVRPFVPLPECFDEAVRISVEASEENWDNQTAVLKLRNYMDGVLRRAIARALALKNSPQTAA